MFSTVATSLQLRRKWPHCGGPGPHWREPGHRVRCPSGSGPRPISSRARRPVSCRTAPVRLRVWPPAPRPAAPRRHPALPRHVPQCDSGGRTIEVRRVGGSYVLHEDGNHALTTANLMVARSEALRRLVIASHPDRQWLAVLHGAGVAGKMVRPCCAGPAERARARLRDCSLPAASIWSRTTMPRSRPAHACSGPYRSGSASRKAVGRCWPRTFRNREHAHRPHAHAPATLPGDSEPRVAPAARALPDLPALFAGCAAGADRATAG